jgi:hypothetical protein
MSDETTKLLAAKFSTIIRDWLTAEELAQCNADNKSETIKGICHTGDYCDSNMAMLEAYESLGLSPEAATQEFFDDDAAISLWNNAWDIAKKAGFSL